MPFLFFLLSFFFFREKEFSVMHIKPLKSVFMHDPFDVYRHVQIFYGIYLLTWELHFELGSS